MLDALEALPRPSLDGIRWASREQWHVTLRFLGNVDVGKVDEPGGARDSLQRAFSTEHPVEAVAGPAVERLGAGVVMLPVAGLDSLARAAVGATAHIGEAPPRRPFVGHVTLARLKRGHQRCPLVGARIAARWSVTEVELIRSHLSSSGPRYETIETVPLNAPAPHRAG